MANVIFRQEAIDDLNDIWFYTFQEWSETQADKYYSYIQHACKSIGENPAIGREYDEIKENLFGLKSQKHIIFYQIVSNDEIEIIRILHGRMDLKNRVIK